MAHRHIVKLSATSKRVASAVLPTRVLRARRHKRMFKQFADKIGMVYFGFVDQREDEHRLVRGLSVSPTHRDNHYCIGSYKGYDVVVLERTDTIHFPRRPARQQEWVIMEFDLHSSVDIPHMFIGLHTHSDVFYAQLFTKFPSLIQAPIGTLAAYGKEFLNRYVVYTTSSHVLDFERLIDPETANQIVKYFGKLTIEVSDGCLYIYSQHQHLSSPLLDAMLQNGQWLAAHIDSQLRQSQSPDSH